MGSLYNHGGIVIISPFSTDDLLWCPEIRQLAPWAIMSNVIGQLGSNAHHLGHVSLQELIHLKVSQVHLILLVACTSRVKIVENC